MTHFGTVHVDIVGPVPKSSNHRHLLTTIDQATSYPVAVMLQSTELIEVWDAFESN